MGEGFYKAEQGALLYAPNRVENLLYLLLVEDHVSYTYPVDGWYYFSSEEEATTYFGDLIDPATTEA
jgi:hypothetical protein